MNNVIYQDLLKQYENLSIMEKQAILIYKSKLFNLINLITSIPGFESLNGEEIVKRLPNVERLKQEVAIFNKVLNLSENMTVKYSIFNLVHLDNFNVLVEDLKQIYFILDRAKTKIILKEDLTVYRGLSLEDKSTLTDLARGNLVSTSIKLEDVENFLDFNKYPVLYVINIKKGTPVLVTPTSLVRTYKDVDDYFEKKLKGEAPTLLKMVNRKEAGQEEIILFKEQLDFVLEKTEEKFLENEILNVFYINSFPKIMAEKRKKNL